MVVALAIYEKEPDSVKIKVEDFERDGFLSNPPLFYAALAEVSHDSGESWQAVGLALFHLSYSTWVGKTLYLEDIFVKSDYRGKGLGRALMAHVVDSAKQMNCSRLQWVVLNWNTKSIDFYKSVGAKPMNEWMIMRLDQNGLENFPRKDSK